MSKKATNILSAKRIRKTIRKNPYTVGVTAALLAIGGVAAEAMRRSPQLAERSRGLKDFVLKRLHARPSNEIETSTQAAAAQPY